MLAGSFSIMTLYVTVFFVSFFICKRARNQLVLFLIKPMFVSYVFKI